VTLTSSGAINQTAGVITAGTLSASGTSIALTPPATGGASILGNQIATAGTITSQGIVSLLNSEPLLVAGPVSGTSVSMMTNAPGSTLTIAGPVTGSSSITLNVADGNVVLDGAVTTPGLLTLASPQQSVLQTGGTISANTLAGIAGADMVLGASGNTVVTLGPVTAGSSLILTDTGPLLVTGPVQAGNASLSATGGITFAGTVSADTLYLAASSGGVTQTSGSLLVNTLTSTNGVVGGATFGSAGNQIAILGGFITSNGNFVLTDSGSLIVVGPLVAPNASITTPGSITLPGAISTGTLDLQVGGSVVRPSGAGAFTVGELTGSVATLANFGTGTDIGTLGSLTVTGGDGMLAVNNAIPLAVTGPITATYIAVTATDRLTLTGTITTTGLPLATQAGSTTPVDPGTYFAVVSGPNGGTSSIQQTGTLVLQPSSGAGTATLRLDLSDNGGSITLNNLVGPQASLILYTRTAGTATGTINVGDLRVVGALGSASLFGNVANTDGALAARNASIRSNPSTNYRINGCPIGSVNCVLLPVGMLPSINPLRDFVLGLGSNSGDEDLALPDVSRTDY
jgi:hypothetical protein